MENYMIAVIAVIVLIIAWWMWSMKKSEGYSTDQLFGQNSSRINISGGKLAK